MKSDILRFCLTPEATIRDAMALIDRNQRGIALVVDAETRLIATVTDGDIRRALLAGREAGLSLGGLLAGQVRSPIFAEASAERGQLLHMMREHRIRQIPLLDELRRVVTVATLDDLLADDILPLQAVIMAGGEGTRLRPLTEDLPKSMLPIGDRPLMEHTLDRLRESGIRHVSVTTRYKGEKIRDYFGDGSSFGLDVSYVAEDQPLGTAGALSRLAPMTGPVLVINGDIISDVDYRAMLAFHVEARADATVAVRRLDLPVPYGLVETEGVRILRVREKPLLSIYVSGGIYLLESTAFRFVPHEARFDMTDLLEVLIAKGREVVSYPIVEYWLDIGRPEDYAQAQRDSARRDAKHVT